MHDLTTKIKIKDQRGEVIGEKEVATYAGLLSLAHDEGLTEITTALIQAPSNDNGWVAICFAKVTTKKGVFTGIGDASAENVGRKIAPHIIRMAETRAKGRALRDAVNIGIVCLEELGGAEGEADQVDEPRNEDRARGNVREFRKPDGERRGERGSDRRDQDRGQQGDRRNERPAEHQNDNRRSEGTSQRGRSDVMTDNQRRFLLRMLSDDGIEGRDAVEVLCNTLGVQSLSEVTKNRASGLIDDWQKAKKRA